MVDIKVGDWVKTDYWRHFYEVLETTNVSFVIKDSFDRKRTFNLNDENWIIRDNPTSSPVREVTTKELVDGVYGRIEIEQHNDDINPVFLRLMDRRQKEAQGQLGFNAKELRELAKTLNEVAEFLEGE